MKMAWCPQPLHILSVLIPVNNNQPTNQTSLSQPLRLEKSCCSVLAFQESASRYLDSPQFSNIRLRVKPWVPLDSCNTSLYPFSFPKTGRMQAEVVWPRIDRHHLGSIRRVKGTLESLLSVGVIDFQLQ